MLLGFALNFDPCSEINAPNFRAKLVLATKAAVGSLGSLKVPFALHSLSWVQFTTLVSMPSNLTTFQSSLSGTPISSSSLFDK